MKSKEHTPQIFCTLNFNILPYALMKSVPLKGLFVLRPLFKYPLLGVIQMMIPTPTWWVGITASIRVQEPIEHTQKGNCWLVNWYMWYPSCTQLFSARGNPLLTSLPGTRWAHIVGWPATQNMNFNSSLQSILHFKTTFLSTCDSRRSPGNSSETAIAEYQY